MNKKTIDMIEVGDKASFSKTITETDVYQYAGITGDFNPAHVDQIYAAASIFQERVAHGMLTAGLISTVLGTRLPGPGTIYLSQELKFVKPVKFNDTITAEVEVVEKASAKNKLKVATRCINQKNELVLTGQAELMPPKS